MTDANLGQAVAAAETAGVLASAPAAAAGAAIATRQTAMTKGFAFLSEIDKLGGATKATVLEDLGLLDASEKKHPFAVGFGAGVIVMALVVLLVLFGTPGHP